jgi:Bacterial protein of unknown function (DUF882)
MIGNICRSVILFPVFICIGGGREGTCPVRIAPPEHIYRPAGRPRQFARQCECGTSAAETRHPAIPWFEPGEKSRTGEVHHFDPRLFDLLSDLTTAVGRPDAEIDVICGYRTPWSNNYLRHHSSGVAQNSLHMQAEAIDIRLPVTKTAHLRQAARSLRRGGVGYYSRSDFIHVDLGRIRYW